MVEKKYRVAILFSELSSYMLACWKALKIQQDVELLVYYWKPVKEAPFQLDLKIIDQLYPREESTARQIFEKVSAFNPDIVLIAGWMDKAYLKAARDLKAAGVPVIATCDNQWQNTLRQRLALKVAPWHLHPAIDVLWVAGDRQSQFAHKLGYSGPKLWQGLYCCDWDQFSYVRKAADAPEEKSFLYVGRYNGQEKALDVLVDAYMEYRTKVSQPWNLVCAGTGEMAHLLQDKPGIIDKGFTQPGELPSLMRRQSVFVLPSRKEPWGVVLQEAAACSLPIICSDACGSSVHLLQDGYNGYVFGTDNTAHLAQCMASMTNLSSEQRFEMGRRSYELSRQFTPQRWAETLLRGISTLKNSL